MSAPNSELRFGDPVATDNRADTGVPDIAEPFGDAVVGDLVHHWGAHCCRVQRISHRESAYGTTGGVEHLLVDGHRVRGCVLRAHTPVRPLWNKTAPTGSLLRRGRHRVSQLQRGQPAKFGEVGFDQLLDAWEDPVPTVRRRGPPLREGGRGCSHGRICLITSTHHDRAIHPPGCRIDVIGPPIRGLLQPPAIDKWWHDTQVSFHGLHSCHVLAPPSARQSGPTGTIAPPYIFILVEIGRAP